MTTNTQYMKRSLLRVETTAELQLNNGVGLDAALDITKYVINLSDVVEKLSKSDVNVGGVILPSLKIKLDNKLGRFNKTGLIFGNGFVNNSLIIITTNYVDVDDTAIVDKFVYKGLLKYTLCEWDRSSCVFLSTLTPPSGLLASEKVADGILSGSSTPIFADVIYTMLNRLPFTKYLTISTGNINLGWDVSAIDQYCTMAGTIVKTVLDKIMLLTGSIYYVNYNQEFVVEPIVPSSPVAICTFRGEDIGRDIRERYDWKGHYTGIKWEDDVNEVQRVEMDYPHRELYQYDYAELKLSDKYITDSAKRLIIMNNLLTMYKFLKREVKLICKWNPEVIVNKYVSLDIPEEAVTGDQYMVWNKNTWNTGKLWGLASPGISFDSNNLWRVVEVKRKTEGEKMQLVLVQLYSDDEV